MKGRDVIELLGKTEGRFFLSYIWRISLGNTYLHLERVLGVDEEKEFRRVLNDRRVARPLQYSLGKWDFFGRTYKVDERALIPRPETELLVEEILKRGIGGKVLADIGTGTGIIIISLLLESIKAGKQPRKLYGTDISEDALNLARENEELLLGANMIQWKKGNLLEPIDSKLDWIVSNPPYIDSAEKGKLQKELEYEPEEALFADDGGLEIYKNLISQAVRYLNDGGSLALEIGYDQGRAIKSMLEVASFENIEILKDYNGRDRMIFANWKTRGGFHVR